MITAERPNCQNDRATGRHIDFLFASDSFTLPLGSACSYFCVYRDCLSIIIGHIELQFDVLLEFIPGLS
jgi:hypothetical protein